MGLALRGKHFCCHHNGSSPTQAMLLKRERGRTVYEKLEGGHGATPLGMLAPPRMPCNLAIQVVRPCMGQLPLQVPHPSQMISDNRHKSSSLVAQAHSLD